MDRLRQKTKKDKPKYADKEKPPLFITDVKTIRENLKIKEILRTVKMNSSMRIKAPRGSRVMQNKDFNDNDEFDDPCSETVADSPSAMNPVLTDKSDIVEVTNDNCVTNENVTLVRSNSEGSLAVVDKKDDNKDGYANAAEIHGEDSVKSDLRTIPVIKATLVDCPKITNRDRKLSLDQTMWPRRQSLSQSEIDLHSIGKSPLERKSSFFRKKMDSFLKNTTEIFKKQSISRSKSELGRRGSMSKSLQSLNDKTEVDNNTSSEYINQGSATSLQSSVTGPSNSTQASRASLAASQVSLTASQVSLTASQVSLPTSQGDRLSPLPADQESLTGSRNAEEMLTGSANNLDDAYLSQGLLNSRAISMSSGLDTAVKRRKRKTSWANRVTWLASETMTNYLKRVIPDDYNRDITGCHSYQDLSSIPENSPQKDSKGRRLSYQRAVSGEDPVLPRQESSLRRRQGIPERPEADFELPTLLADWSENGVPTLRGYNIKVIVDQALACLMLASKPENLLEICTYKLSPYEETRQAVIRELVSTEAAYIKHLLAIVEIFIATAHALQDAGKLLDIDTSRLFSNIPDVLNASLTFWEGTIFPMLSDAIEKRGPLNTDLMMPGFFRFREVFIPYERFVCEQTKALDYLRSLNTNVDFMTYLTWCHGHSACKRLQLADILVKPMQRMTKYGLILRRIIQNTETEPEKTALEAMVRKLLAMETYAKGYVLDLNRCIRQKEELEKLDYLGTIIDPYEVDFKDEEIEKHYKVHAHLHLRAPMLNCVPSHSRCLIFQGDLRFKDHINHKEIDVHIILLTDMILICKRQTKGNPFRMIRPKFMIDKTMHYPRLNKAKDIVAIVFVVVDDVGSSQFGFAVTEAGKPDPGMPAGAGSLKMWEAKVREARLSYDLGVWHCRNPCRDLSEVDWDSSSDNAGSASSPMPSSEDANIEREARERTATMLHRSMGTSTDYDFSQGSFVTDSFDGTSGPRTSGALRHPMMRNSTGGSSRNSRLSSFQQSTSAASHDEPGPSGISRPLIKAGSSTEQPIPENSKDQAGPNVVSPITVNVVSESESETIVPEQQNTPASPSKLNPRLSAHGSGYSLGPGPSGLQVNPGSSNTLRVQPQSPGIGGHSLPDLTIDPNSPRTHPPYKRYLPSLGS
ncbi:uncharacterized protein LOC106130581 isoform X2 [Amyelois transitella]|uniref:uncharacterized protein LOC106130581 isoform X2 n=1 Tax=Amyelois transitella TaxID=680683 RepID=UPI00067E4EB2|nr:uncharacterized protein LOC106130581 isoform X2 [Amyelois transitella]